MMLKKTCGALIAIAIALWATTAMAQNAPPGRWWKSPKVVKALNLTPGETQRLEKAYGQSRQKLINKKNRVKSEQAALKQLMNTRGSDKQAIRAQNRKLEKARSELADEKFGFVIQVREIIGHERFQRLVKLGGR